MAIEPGSKSINEFHQHYKKTILSTFIFFLIGLIVTIGLVLHFSKIATITELNFWIVIICVFIITTGAGLFLIKVVTAPMCQILLALAHKNSSCAAKAIKFKSSSSGRY
jgi:hypothetical protein